MSWQTKSLKNPQVNQQTIDSALLALMESSRPRHQRLWAYYRNPLRVDLTDADRPYRQAQEWGLPTRITGLRAGTDPFSGQPAGTIRRKEIVIENDIAWRIEAMVDYLFGKPLAIRSSAADPNRRDLIDRLTQAILAHNGGILLLQQLAFLGSVHGFVDLLVKLDAGAGDTSAARRGQRLDERTPHSPSLGRAHADAHTRIPADSPDPAQSSTPDQALPASLLQAAAAATEPEQSAPTAGDGHSPAPKPADADPADPGPGHDTPDALLQRIARMIRLEIVDPSRSAPLLSPADYRILDAYVQHYDLPAAPTNAHTRPQPRQNFWQRLFRSAESLLSPAESGQTVVITEIITPAAWQKYENAELVAQGENSLGEIPLVHIQNTAIPFEYAGGSDVEPLLPLQDELNTRLCDRANRIALQSFKMYLGKGIENFNELPVAPGRMWSTDNESAQVQEFGGDTAAPSENQHITDVREAMDKTSGVSPVAAGAIKNRIGHLTSAAALRITLISLLAKTEKKRTTYGAGIARMIDLSLRWLDLLGVFPTTPEERMIEIHWPSPLPENDTEKLDAAEIKLRLGISREVVLRELGY